MIICVSGKLVGLVEANTSGWCASGLSDDNHHKARTDIVDEVVSRQSADNEPSSIGPKN